MGGFVQKQGLPYYNEVFLEISRDAAYPQIKLNMR